MPRAIARFLFIVLAVNLVLGAPTPPPKSPTTGSQKLLSVASSNAKNKVTHCRARSPNVKTSGTTKGKHNKRDLPEVFSNVKLKDANGKEVTFVELKRVPLDRKNQGAFGDVYTVTKGEHTGAFAKTLRGREAGCPDETFEKEIEAVKKISANREVSKYIAKFIAGGMDTGASSEKYQWLVTENAANGGYYLIHTHPVIDQKRKEGIEQNRKEGIKKGNKVCEDFIEKNVFPKLVQAHDALVNYVEIYHLDASHRNVFFSKDFEAKLIDFGKIKEGPKGTVPHLDDEKGHKPMFLEHLQELGCSDSPRI